MMMMMKLLLNNWPLKFSNCVHSVEIYLVSACTPGEEVFYIKRRQPNAAVLSTGTKIETLITKQQR